MEQQETKLDTLGDQDNVEPLTQSATNDSTANVIVETEVTSPVDLVKAHTKQLEAAMKLDLRKMHALVGQKVDIKNRTSLDLLTSHWNVIDNFSCTLY